MITNSYPDPTRLSIPALLRPTTESPTTAAIKAKHYALVALIQADARKTRKGGR